MTTTDKLVTIAENQEKVYRAGASKFAAQDIPDVLEFPEVPMPDISDMTWEEKMAMIEQQQYKVFDAGVRKYAYTKTSEASDFVTIADSAGYEVFDFGMDGNTEQDETPTPDTPVNIIHAGKVGKNLWNAEYASDCKNWVNFGWYDCIPVKVPKGETITVSYKKTLDMGLGIYSVVNSTGTNNTPNANKWLYHSGSASLINTKQTFVTTSDYIYVCCNGASYDTNTKVFMENVGNDLQIEVGSEVTEYEPFHYEVGCGVSGKNLYSGGDIVGTGNSGIINIKPIPAGTYMISLDLSSTDTDNSNRMLYFYYENGGGVGKSLPNGTRKSVSITFTDSVNKFIFYASNNAANSEGDTFSYTNIQIEVGSTATAYSPYREPKSFSLTSPVQLTKWDKLVKRDGVWGWSINASQIRLPDYTKWIQGTSNHDGDGIIYRTTSVGSFPTTLFGSLCEYLYENHDGKFAWERLKLNQYWSDSGNHFVICTNHSSLEEFVQWINEVNCTIIFDGVEEQAFHPLPDEEQTLLNTLETYQGGTNLYNDQGCPMWVKYVVDPTTY